MFPSHHPCIDTNECESFGDLSHHPVKERTNTKKEKIKKMPSCNIKKIGC